MRVQTRETIKTITEIRPSQNSDKTSCRLVTISVISAPPIGQWEARGVPEPIRSRAVMIKGMWRRRVECRTLISVLKCNVWINNIWRRCMEGHMWTVYCIVTPCNTFRTWLVLHTILRLGISCDKLKPQHPDRDVSQWKFYVVSRVPSWVRWCPLPSWVRWCPRASHLQSQHPLSQTHSSGKTVCSHFPINLKWKY